MVLQLCREGPVSLYIISVQCISCKPSISPLLFFLFLSPFFLLAPRFISSTCDLLLWFLHLPCRRLPAHHLLCERVNLPGSRRGVYFLLFLSNLTDSCHVPWLTVQKAFKVCVCVCVCVEGGVCLGIVCWSRVLSTHCTSLETLLFC